MKIIRTVLSASGLAFLVIRINAKQILKSDRIRREKV
jgi:hypothetical protein